ncbi:NARE ribosyltransferase, partial [Regulus satrapa]|nr:NARE ribosyltransferase [Regulus satrapa]
WPLPAMAPLALTLALLAMTVATAVTKGLPLDMAQDSFDDQYRGCGPAMAEALPALNRSEFQKNPLFARVWPKAVVEWQKKGSPLSPLSPPQAIALMAYTMNDLYQEFNTAVRKAGRSRQEYRDNFHFKTLHFLLTDALATLKSKEKQKCRCVFRGVTGTLFTVQPGQRVRFGQFASSSLCRDVAKKTFGKDVVFQVNTCHGAAIQKFSKFKEEKEVLIPPFETFNVTNVTLEENRQWIYLNSTETCSKYNCEYLRGDTAGTALGTP